MPWLTGVKSRSGLTVPLKRFSVLALGRMSSYRVGVIYNYSKFCFKLARRQGIPGLAKHLKSCNILLMQYLAGRKHKSSQCLGPSVARTHSGIPRCIPLQDRRSIRGGDLPCIRFWLSLFQLYRVLDWAGTLKLSTITKKRPDFELDELLLWMGEIRRFLEISPFPERLEPKDLRAKPLLIHTSSPSTKDGSTSIFSSITDAGKWAKDENFVLWLKLKSFVNICGNS